VSSRVANVSDFLQSKIEVDEFKNLIIENIKNCVRYELLPEEVAEVQKLAQEKYRTDDWNFGKVTAHAFSKHEKTAAGSEEVKINLTNGSIDNIRFFGDFFSDSNVHELEQLLQGTPYNPNAVESALRKANVPQYIRNLSAEELMKVMF
jgi:lipoate-protein ligase A